MIVRGKVWKFGDDINTDLIMPHAALRVSPEEQAKLVFSDNRPGWAAQVQPGDVIVAGSNFGTGSSRPGSVLLRRLQLSGMVADSINGLFFRNCIGYGFPAMQCEGVSKAFEEGDIAIINLETGTVKNERTGQTLQGASISQSMIDTLAAGGIQELLKSKGYLR